MHRKVAREIAMQLMFQMSIQNDYSVEVINQFLQQIPEKSRQINYIQKIAQTFIQNKDKIDLTIEKSSMDWKLSRMAKVDLAALRIAVTEILYFDDIPVIVSINEAIELVKKFSTEESGSFVNGILGSIIEKK
jgi:N utilization substance protein B